HDSDLWVGVGRTSSQPDLRVRPADRRPGAAGGTTACFFRMKHSGIFFGTENGRNIEVTGPKGGTQALAETGVSAATLGFDPKLEWLDGARGSGTTQIPLDATAFRSAESVVFEYAYAHETPRSIDIVFKYVFDPAVFEPLSVEPGVAGLVVMAGLGAPGEFWVRFVGNVPEGSGRIAGLPFRLLPSAKAPTQSSATLTIYYPQE
ncbi:MAG: hypothetical protein ACREMK_12690, partial [Gemmatimonadota bacterium]